MSKQHTVIAVLEANPGKEFELESALQVVAEYSRAESANIEYRLHKSTDNPRQFILYENWASKEKHQEQFDKPYIKELAEKLGSMLAKPYEAYISEEI
ncbi:MAG: putative quinol monooxygenase [Gammaproteobacteria bacterium]